MRRVIDWLERAAVALDVEAINRRINWWLRRLGTVLVVLYFLAWAYSELYVNRPFR